MRKETNHSGIQPKSRFHDGRADGLLRTFLARTTASAQGSPDGFTEHSGHEPSGLAGIHPHTAAVARIPNLRHGGYLKKTGLDWEMS